MQHFTIYVCVVWYSRREDMCCGLFVIADLDISIRKEAIEVDNYHRSFGFWVYECILIYYIFDVCTVYSLVRIRNSRREDMCWSVRYWLGIYLSERKLDVDLLDSFGTGIDICMIGPWSILR